MKKREEYIKFRVTETEKKTIQSKAKKQGLKVSDYGRKIMLNGSVFMLEKEEVFNLKKIGINLNQIARHANQTKAFSSEKVLEQCNELQKILKEVLKKTEIIKAEK